MSIRPRKNPDYVLRVRPPDPPIIFNKRNGMILVASNYDILRMIELMDGNRTVREILVEPYGSKKFPKEFLNKVMFLLTKLKDKEVLMW
jgi:hypothetical protein